MNICTAEHSRLTTTTQAERPKSDDYKMSWIQSILFFNGFPTNFSLNVLLNSTVHNIFIQSKS